MLLADLQDYIVRKKTAARRNGRHRVKAASQAIASEPQCQVQRAILSILENGPMAPAAIASEVAIRKNLSVSMRSVGVAIHELAKAGRIRMVGPALYAKVG